MQLIQNYGDFGSLLAVIAKIKYLEFLIQGNDVFQKLGFFILRAFFSLGFNILKQLSKLLIHKIEIIQRLIQNQFQRNARAIEMHSKIQKKKSRLFLLITFGSIASRLTWAPAISSLIPISLNPPIPADPRSFSYYCQRHSPGRRDRHPCYFHTRDSTICLSE